MKISAGHSPQKVYAAGSIVAISAIYEQGYELVLHFRF